MTGDSDGGEGGSVSVEYGYGGIGVGTGVDGTPGFFVVRTSAGDDVLKMDTDDTAGNTRMLIYDVDSGSLERVKVGSNNSGPGGSGRALYIDNN